MDYNDYSLSEQSEDASGCGNHKGFLDDNLFKKLEPLKKKPKYPDDNRNIYIIIHDLSLSQIENSKLNLYKHYKKLHEELETEKEHLIKSLDNYREKLCSGYYKDYKIEEVSNYIASLLFNLKKYLEITNSSNTLMIGKDNLYRGNARQGIKDGKGATLNNNLKVIQFGSYKNGLIDGHGVCFDHQLNRYEGDWDNGKRTGQGVLKYSTGEVYKGSFLNNKCSGRGELDYNNGYTFSGIFEDDLYKVGTLCLPDGDKYIGPFQDQKYSGKGEYFSANGTYYKGLFLNGRYHGKGKIQYPSGEIYRGNWGEGMRNARGICVYPNNDIYEGHWQNNERHGRGKMTYSDGTVKEGIWHKGEIHGKGFFTSKDGIRVGENFE